MGPKKRPAHSKQPPTAKSTTAHGGESPNTADVLPQELSVIKRECESTFTALHRGNLNKAQKHIKEACIRHENSALLHHVQAIVHSKEASLITDDATKQKHLKNAVESAKKAVSLSPNSVDFAFFHANLLLELSKDTKTLEEVVRECERALSIINPIKPNKETLQEVIQSKASTAKSLILNIRQELESLLQKSKVSMISTGIHNLEICQESSEDPMLKIKKANKTPEDRRKEIEVRVAAARLLQQNFDSISQSDSILRSQDVYDKEIESNLATNKVEKRRKDANWKKFMESVEGIKQAQVYWNSLRNEEKRELFKLGIEDVRIYYSQFNDDMAAKIFSEAIGFAEEARSWKYWDCILCGVIFLDSYSVMEHLKQHHGVTLSNEIRAILPDEISSDWKKMILNCIWKPVDSVLAVKIIENESPRGPNDNWPLCNDTERVNSLEKIRYMFQLLFEHKYISASSFEKIMDYTIDELKKIISESQIRIHGLHKSPLCMCFLGAPQLKGVLESLQEIYNACVAESDGCYPKKKSFMDHEVLKIIQEYKTKERIVFSGDTLCIPMGDISLLHGAMPLSDDDGDVDDGSAASFADVDHEDDNVPYSDVLVVWLFADIPIEEQLASWKRQQDVKQHQGAKIIEIIEKELIIWKSMCERKCELMSQKEELLASRSICLQEIKNRLQGAKYIPQSFESLLRKRVDEYTKRGDSSMAELLVTSKVLEEALKTNSQEDLHQKDICIKSAIDRQLKQRSEDLFRIDASLLRSYADLQQLEFKLTLVSGHDYRLIVMPLLKAFIKAQLEGLAYDDALEKSDAAREELLAELELDDWKNLSKGHDQTKQTDGKSKKKKKNKNYRDDKNSKANRAKQQQMLQVQDVAVEQVHFPVSPDELTPGEEELRLKIELEEQARMLEEKLEYQRRIENEAKQKRLAEENEKEGKTTPEKEETCATTPEKEKETYASMTRKGLS